MRRGAGPIGEAGADARDRRSKLGAIVLLTATAFGFLFGITAPAVSPVTPPPPGISAPAAAASGGG